MNSYLKILLVEYRIFFFFFLLHTTFLCKSHFSTGKNFLLSLKQQPAILPIPQISADTAKDIYNKLKSMAGKNEV